jgi:sugar phosphate isomerase/epimerase
MNRRQFVRTSVLGTAALAAASLPSISWGAVTKAAADPFTGLKVGITSYSLRKFTLDQAIAMTKQAGVKYISLKDMHLPLNSTLAQRQEARKKIEDAGLVLMGCGVVYLTNNADEIRRAFDYARDAGMPTIIASPDPEALDQVEKAAKEYNIRVAIHNHGPTDKRYPSPMDVLRLVKDRDARMGICMDVGHTVRIGEDPVPAIEQCAGRLYDFHIKDVTEATARGASIAVGRGVIDIVAVLKALLRVKFPYHVALEHEADPDAPLPGITESYGYLRGALAAMK